MNRIRAIGFFGVFLAILLYGIFGQNSFAATPEELRQQIAKKNADITKLEEEIKGFQSSLNAASKEASTLQNEVRKFDLNIKNLSAEISLTQAQINKKELEIEQFGYDIDNTEVSLKEKQKILGNILRELNERESENMVEIILKYGSLSRFFETLESFRALDTHLKNNYELLSEFKNELEDKQAAAKSAQNKLLSLQVELGDRRKLEELEKKDKDQLLKTTKNQEAQYQKLLEEKRAQKEEFEAELKRIESELQFELDKSKIPKAGSGILLWPLEGAKNESCYSTKNPAENCITQYFGNTEFAKSAAYNGQGHNGVDFRASLGTKVRAVFSGVVKEVNHGAAPGCQYGKWVLIEHGNGLSTLYAHLSLIKEGLGVGATLATGDTIGYSGSTGYSLGPHLHFSLYVSEAISLRNYTCKSGTKVTIPVAAFNAYLNPIDYL